MAEMHDPAPATADEEREASLREWARGRGWEVLGVRVAAGPSRYRILAGDPAAPDRRVLAGGPYAPPLDAAEARATAEAEPESGEPPPA